MILSTSNKLLIFTLLCVLCLSCGKKETKINGEIFVSVASGQSIKLGAVNIFLFRKVRADGYEQGGASPLDYTDKADFRTVSDADGKFSFTVPPDNYSIAVQTEKSVSGQTENLAWLQNISTKNGDVSISLNNRNMR